MTSVQARPDNVATTLATWLRNDFGDCDSTVLYRVFGPPRSPYEGNLIYVGISGNPGRRFKEHRRRSWWPDARVVVIQEFVDRIDAELAETIAIVGEHPDENRRGTGVSFDDVAALGIPRAIATTVYTLSIDGWARSAMWTDDLGPVNDGF